MFKISTIKVQTPNIKIEDHPRTAYEKNEVVVDDRAMRTRHKIGQNGLHVESR